MFWIGLLCGVVLSFGVSFVACLAYALWFARGDSNGEAPT